MTPASTSWEQHRRHPQASVGIRSSTRQAQALTGTQDDLAGRRKRPGSAEDPCDNSSMPNPEPPSQPTDESAAPDSISGEMIHATAERVRAVAQAIGALSAARACDDLMVEMWTWSEALALLLPDGEKARSNRETADYIAANDLGITPEQLRVIRETVAARQ